MEFERQAEIMDMKEEMMNDAIDDAMGDEEDEEERYGETGWEGRGVCLALMECIALIEFSLFPSDAVVSQVLDELGLSLTDELSSECSKTWAPFPTQGPATAPSPPFACITPLPCSNPHFLCRPPLNWRLAQCGCWWEKSRGRSLSPS